uniref:SYO1-like TPR repeats domain-containing protein n=1 Tax=Strigamia maritima TaxID=126957 RepID=T1J284_STRMM
MGKAKRNRQKRKTSEPTGLPSVKDMEEMEEMEETTGTAEESVLVAIIEKLHTSTTVEEKECACQSLSVAVIADPSIISEILKSDVIRMMAPLLMDPSYVVRHSVASALRNLSTMGHETCDAMVEQDVMTPLVALLKQHREEGWILKKTKKTEGKINTKLEILIDATHLFENNNTAIRVFNREEILSIIIQFINREVYGDKLAVAAAQCLHTTSEDNPKAIELLSQLSFSLPIETLIKQSYNGNDTTLLLLRSLAAGILLNVYHGKLSDCSVSVVAAIMTVVSETLKSDFSTLITNLLEKEELLKNDRLEEEIIRSVSDNDFVIDSLENEVENILAAQVASLEILTNVCCNDGDEDDDVNSSDASDELFCNDEEMMDDDTIKFPLTIATEISEAILSHNLLRMVLNKLNPFPDQLSKPSKEMSKLKQSITKHLLTLQCRALLCFNNLVSCLDIEELGQSDELYSTWCKLAQLCFRHTPLCSPDSESDVYCNKREHVDFLEANTSALRALTQKLALVKVPQLEHINPSEIHSMAELAQTSSEFGIRINIINIVGTIGQVLAEKASDNDKVMPLLKNIGLFFLEMASKDNVDLIVVAEAFDAIFDVFGVDDLNHLCQEINLIERLKHLLPILKHKVQSQRKTLGDHYSIKYED